MKPATMSPGDAELFMPTFSAAACPPHRVRIGFSDWCDSRPSAAMCGDHGSANPSGQVCAARGRRPAADRSALTRARIWLSYASVPLCGGGGGGTGPGFGAGLGLGLGVGLAPGLGVLRGVEVRVGAERGGGGTEVGAGVGAAVVGAAASDGNAVAAGDAVSVVVGAAIGDAGEVGATATRETVTAGSLQAVTPTARHAAPSAVAANRTRGSDMTAETTPSGPSGPGAPRDVVGCTSRRRRS